MLECFYGFYQPLQEQLDVFISDAIVPRYSERRRADAILHDLQAIETAVTANTILICRDLPQITNPTEAFGVMYVLEGSTLGGVFIAKMLSAQAAIAPDQLTFFKGYGEQEGTLLWKLFIIALNEHAVENNAGQAIIQAACDTFAKFNNWTNSFYKLREVGNI